MVEETTADIQIRGINKRTIAAIVGFLVLGGLIPVANMVTDQDTTDRFYGHEGRRLQRDSDSHAQQLKSHSVLLEGLKDEIVDIRNNDETCIERQMRVENDIEELQDIGKALHDKVYEFQARKNAVDTHQSQLIDLCMGRTQ